MYSLRHIIKEILAEQDDEVTADSQKVSGLGSATATMPPRTGPLMCLHDYKLKLLGQESRGIYRGTGQSHAKIYEEEWIGYKASPYAGEPDVESGAEITFRIQFGAEPLPDDTDIGEKPYAFMMGIVFAVNRNVAQSTIVTIYWPGMFKCAGGGLEHQGKGKLKFLAGGYPTKTRVWEHLGHDGRPNEKMVAEHYNLIMGDATAKKVYTAANNVLKGIMTFEELQVAVAKIDT